MSLEMPMVSAKCQYLAVSIQLQKTLPKTLVSVYIQFPMTNTDRQSVMFNFYDIKEFPLVLGAVDGTLIPTKAPSVDEHLYVCRKGFHALNVQGVCDANNLFTNIVAHHAGSTHDAHIWNNCKLSEAFGSGVIKNGWLLGDSGYGLKPWLLTPVLNSSTAAERKYNKAHKSTRCVIERTFGIWKMRFRCIYRGLTFTPKRSQYIVLATAGLHNKCVRKRLPLPDDYDMQDDDNVDNVGGQIDTENGRRIRQEVIETTLLVLELYDIVD